MTSLTTGVWGSFTTPCSRALGGKSWMTRAAPLVCFALYRQPRQHQASLLSPERSRLPKPPRAPDFRPALLALVLLLILAAPWSTRVASVPPVNQEIGLWTWEESGCGRAGTGAREARARR